MIKSILENFFADHFKISFDLLMNSLIVSYSLTESTQFLLSQAIKILLPLDEKGNIRVLDLILLTDFISIPYLMINILQSD